MGKTNYVALIQLLTGLLEIQPPSFQYRNNETEPDKLDRHRNSSRPCADHADIGMRSIDFVSLL
jgi:hypothetical protein